MVMNTLGKMKIWQKLCLLVTILMVPLAVVIYLLVDEKQTEV